MAIAAGCVWEIRTTGSATGSGGFVSGGAGAVDYSQQPSPQYNFTNLASTSGTTNPSVVTSASHNFVAADVGNIIYISAGTSWLANYYQIVSCAGNAATLDRACASSATVTAGTFSVGGAIKLQGTSTPDDLFTPKVVAGHTVWFGPGTHTSYQLDFGAGTAALPVRIEGYLSTRGDNPGGSNRPSIDLGIGYQWNLGSYYTVKNLNLYPSSVGNTSNRILNLGGAGNTIVNCKLRNNNTTADEFCILGNFGVVIGCELICENGYAVSFGFSGKVINCYIHDSKNGVNASGANAQVSVIGTIIEGCSANAVLLDTAGTLASNIHGCTIYGSENKLGTGVNIVAGYGECSITNTILYGLVTGVSAGSAGAVNFYDDFNSYFNNTADTSNWTKGPSTVNTNPTFAGVAQYVGTTATTSAGKIVDSGANFANVVDNQDLVWVPSGTGIVAGIYLIVGHTSTSLTLDNAIGNNATADKHYQVTTGHNFAVGSNMQALGLGVPGGLSTSYQDIGAVQRKERVSTSPGVGNVRSGTGFTINDAALTGTMIANLASDTKHGVTSDGGTGTYQGDDVNDLLLATNVKHGVAVLNRNVTVTGTYQGDDVNDVLSAANLKHGVAVLNRNATVTGTYQGDDVNDLLLATNVKHGVAVLNRNVTVTGTYRGADLWTALTADKIKLAEVQTQDGSVVTGTYDGSDRWTSPIAGDLRTGTALKSNSLTNNLTGTMVANLASDTKHGVTSDGGVGTYRGADLWTALAANKIKLAEVQTQDGATVTGTYAATCDYPVVADVRKNTSFALGLSTGTLDLTTGANIRAGITQDNGNIVGTLDTTPGEVNIDVAADEPIYVTAEG